MFIKEKERIYMNNEEGQMVAEVTFPEVREGVNNGKQQVWELFY